MTLARSRARLTRRGQLATTLFTASLVVGRSLGLTVLTVLGVFGVLWLITQYTWLAIDRAAVTASVSSPPQQVTIGQRWHVRYTLLADRPIGKVQLVETRHSSHQTTTADHIWIGAIAPGRPVKCATSVYTDRREVVTITHARLWRSDPLGLVVRSWIIDPDVWWICTPAAIAPRHDEWQRVLAAVRDMRTLEPPTDFAGVRAFVDGDDPRRVDWRRTSRSDQLIVRQLDRPPHHPSVTIEIGPPAWTDQQAGRVAGWINAIVAEWPEATINVSAGTIPIALHQLQRCLASNTVPETQLVEQTIRTELSLNVHDDRTDVSTTS